MGKKRHIVRKDRDQVTELYSSGLGCNPIANLCHMGLHIVQRVVREAGIARSIRVPRIYPDTKVCPVCGLEKPIGAFGERSRPSGRVNSYCKECKSERERPGYMRRQYGISLEEYDNMYEAQNGLCACCGQPETCLKKNKLTRLSVDHNHQTGKVRQLLCQRCNFVIGLIAEDLDLCELIRQYVLTHQRKEDT